MIGKIGGAEKLVVRYKNVCVLFEVFLNSMQFLSNHPTQYEYLIDYQLSWVIWKQMRVVPFVEKVEGP